MPKPEFPAEKNKQTKGKGKRGGAFRSGAFSVETFLKVLIKKGKCYHVGGLVLKAGVGLSKR
jgi:hypothetical protein